MITPGDSHPGNDAARHSSFARNESRVVDVVVAVGETTGDGRGKFVSRISLPSPSPFPCRWCATRGFTGRRFRASFTSARTWRPPRARRSCTRARYVTPYVRSLNQSAREISSTFDIAPRKKRARCLLYWPLISRRPLRRTSQFSILSATHARSFPRERRFLELAYRLFRSGHALDESLEYRRIPGRAILVSR